jgi:hypothetical protein
MEGLNMVYNSQKEELIIPEYGRNVQELVKHCKTIEDKEVRQATAEEIVALMARMSSPNKLTPEFIHKLWKHFIIIAEFDIDVQLPEGLTVRPEDQGFHPEKPDYPEYLKEFRHYGHFVHDMVEKAMKMEDGPLKDQYFRIIGSYMKLAYRTWNREHYVSDEIVKEDLMHMTNGQVKLNGDMSLDFHSSLNSPQQPHSQHTKRRRQSKGGAPRRSSGGSRFKKRR